MEQESRPIRILVVDDHPIVRQGLRSLLSAYAELQIVAEAGSPQQAIEAAIRHNPDIVLLDVRLPGASGVEVARQLQRDCPTANVILLTSFDDDEYLLGALEVGVRAYLLKSVSDDMLVWTIRAVFRGERLISPEMLDRMLSQFSQMRASQIQQEIGLSEQDVEVLRRLASGASNDEIGFELGWSKASVKRRVQHIFDQLGVTTRAQAAAEAVRRGLA
ncbi:MAG TPA: response regulator transcription factor [Ktedonobacterales bacterium]|nr:response regulator transcription factor [Ktedonobacterales bacterium]